MRITCLAFVVLCACNEHGKGGGGVVDATGGMFCGGFTSAQCTPAEFCDFGRNDCGAVDSAGMCRPRPQVCDASFMPACGCDGHVYNNECEAAAAGVDVSVNSSCPVPAGKFACGFTQCTLASQYCEHTQPTNGTDTFRCVPLPAMCSVIPTCPCLAGEMCGGACTGDATSGLTATCN